METGSSRRAALCEERGFTLIELLVVVLIIGILAGAALTTFIGQTHKAYDASAKQLASSAQLAAETYAMDNGGSYKQLSVAVVHEYDLTIPTAAGLANAGAWLQRALEIEGGAGYEVTAIAPKLEGERFTMVRRADGTLERLCAPTSAARGCAKGTW